MKVFYRDYNNIYLYNHDNLTIFKQFLLKHQDICQSICKLMYLTFNGAVITYRIIKVRIKTILKKKIFY